MFDTDLSKLQQLQSAVRQGLETGKWKAVDSYIDDNCSLVFNFGSPHEGEAFDDEVFDYILELLSDEQFLTVHITQSVILILHYDFNLLSSEQRGRVLIVMEHAYPFITYIVGIFLLAETMGKYYCDRNSLLSLERLVKHSPPAQRELAVMGIGYISRNKSDQSLAERAKALLLQMSTDPLDEVKYEALRCLARLNVPGRESKRTGRFKRPSKRQ